jgi:PilZ domain
MSTWDPTRGGPDTNRRRSQRVIVNVPITVSNEGGNRDAAFQEETQTLVVNAHGAMIALTARVVKGQSLRMKNRVTQEEQACKVVYLGPMAAGKAQVGVDFTSNSPDFWRIAFPPEDWVMPAPDPVPTVSKKK